MRPIAAVVAGVELRRGCRAAVDQPLELLRVAQHRGLVPRRARTPARLLRETAGLGSSEQSFLQAIVSRAVGQYPIMLFVSPFP